MHFGLENVVLGFRFLEFRFHLPVRTYITVQTSHVLKSCKAKNALKILKVNICTA